MNDPVPHSVVTLAEGPSVLGDLRWDNHFGRLPAGFYTRLKPTPLPEPYLVAVSQDAAGLIGLAPDVLTTDEFRDVFVGNLELRGTDPLAAVYSGHQFGVYVPQLGDGRAILLGGAIGPDGGVWELQLKGSGKTPYSRMGDGRAVLRSSIREFLCSEAMHALGIPTTRALSIVGADFPVIRETVETAAVITRMSSSFVRIGNFEFFFWRNRHEELRQLADYVIDRFYPACRDAPEPYLALLEEVARRTARLIAQWQGVGFCHGVMNTDNLSILGLTIDYGPFGFLDAFDARHICNHSDEQGRYAYNMQPEIANWNLHCFGQALIPLTGDVEKTQASLMVFRGEFMRAIGEVFGAKLGFAASEAEDSALLERLLDVLQNNRIDWTIFWRKLAQLRIEGTPADDAPMRDLFADRDAFDHWAVEYRARLRREASVDAERAARMNRVNPKYVLRNYLAEAAIRRANERDFSEIARLLAVLRRPFDEQPENESYAAPPPDWALALHLSCSS